MKGGYRFFRRAVLEQFKHQYDLFVIGGKTGSGKTSFIKTLRNSIDLESLAHHRGSVFGGIESVQPTQEQFENEFALQLSNFATTSLVVEDESRFIGRIRIPDPFFAQMQRAKFILLEVSLQKRVETILQEYGSLPKEKLEKAILILKKRLGYERMNKALLYLREDNLKQCCELLLSYYDKKYAHSISRKEAVELSLLAQFDRVKLS